MKTDHTILSLLAACSLIPASAATLLDIGPSNSVSNGSGAIGFNNTVVQPHSLVVGIHNELWQDDNQNSSFVAGRYNTVEGAWGVTGGQYNTVFGNGSLTVGYLNFNSAYHTIVGGRGHVLSGSAYTDGLVIGRYSAPLSMNKPAHLVVGNGPHSSQRNNSFIVHADGDIVITKPQGDISMGIYGD